MNMLESGSQSSTRARTVGVSDDSLAARVRRCCNRAAEIGKPVLMRMHLALELVDPWAFLGEQEAVGAPFFAWNDGKTGLCVGAFGEAAAYRCGEGRERFSQARQHAALLLESVVDLGWPHRDMPRLDVPLAFGGFAFDDRALEGAWAGWPSGLLYVPRTMLYCQQGQPSRSGAVLHLQVAADSNVDGVVQELGQLIVELRRRARAHAVQPTASPCQPECKLVEDRTSFVGRVEQARRAADGGGLDKVVVARAAEFSAPRGYRFAPLDMLEALRVEHPHSICFAMAPDAGRCFLGATPEVLAHVSGKVLRTHSLAGTAPRGTTAEHDAAIGQALVDSVKDQREHALVADALSEALQAVCVEVETAPVPRLVKLPQVQHLETPFSGRLRRAGGIIDLVERLHPTPSVGGAPSGLALQWLTQCEPTPRGWYAGPIGWITAAGDGVFAVAIRSVLVQENSARAYAGAGIVAASDPDAEWNETELKLRTVRDVLKVKPE